MNKKGQTVSIDTVIIIAISLFIFVLVAIAIFAGSDALQSSNIFSNSTGTGFFVNETINLTLEGNAPSTVSSLGQVALSNLIIYNYTGGLVNAGNYTTSGPLTQSIAGGDWLNQNVNVSANFTHQVRSNSYNDSNLMLGNLTSATTAFSENFTTFMSILAVVIIMGFIGLLIFVVLRFRGAAKPV